MISRGEFMMNPLVSVIVPIFKVEQYLDECVKSILSQTFQDFELILVNDGSPDNCPNLCDAWLTKDKRIHVIHKKNGGVSDARNAGIDSARGKYLTFVDSDDYIMPIMLERLVQYLIEHCVDVVISDGYLSFQDAQSLTVTYDSYDHDYFCVDAPNALNIVFSETYRWEVWGNLYKSELFRNNRFNTDMVYAEDFDLVLRLFLEANNILFTKEKFYCYRLRIGSAMHSLKKIVPSNLYLSAQRNIDIVHNTQYPQKYKYRIIAGILLEVATRVDYVQNEALKGSDYESCSRLRRLLRNNKFCILKADNIAGKKKAYMLLVAYSLLRIYKFISYKHRSAKNTRGLFDGR